MENIVGQRIKDLRKKYKMSVDELADKVGKSRATIYRYENGEIENAPYTVLVPFAKALNTTPTYLMGVDDEPNIKQGETLNKQIGERIRQSRKAIKISMKELGSRVGLHESTVSRYENGEINALDIDILNQFAKALNVSPSYLLGWQTNNLKEIRNNHNKTLEEIASEIHISSDLLRQYENGEKKIPFDVLQKLSNYFKVTIDYLEGINFSKRDEETKNETANRIIQRAEQWNKEVGVTEFSDEEMVELMNFAKYLISKRK